MTLTPESLRRQAVSHSLFAPTSLGDAVKRLGFVQADPIRSPARAQDLILRHRVEGYRAGDLEALYPALPLEEDSIHIYAFLPSATLDLLHPRPRQWRIEREHPGLAEQVLEFVRANGETHHRDLEEHFGAVRTTGSWGVQAKATTRVLDMMHYRGLLRVARRRGNDRFYMAAQPRDSGLTPDERLRKLLLIIMRSYAPVSDVTLRDVTNRLRYSVHAPSARDAIAALLKSGELESALVKGITYYWAAGDVPDGEPPESVRMLAPFDPIVWDRRRFEHLWGWPYRFEAYTPPAKRRWGYYALPLLWRDRVIGWANVSTTGGELQVEIGFIEARPPEANFETKLEAEIARMRSFLRVGDPDAREER